MKNSERKHQQAALTEWLAKHNWTVFGTLKFNNGFEVGERYGDAMVKNFFNRIDRIYYGSNLVNAGHRVDRVVSKHLGPSAQNLHYHFVARPNSDPINFCINTRCIWDEVSPRTLGYEKTWIDPVRDNKAASHYLLHEYPNLHADTLFVEASHLNHHAKRPKPLSVLRRLLKRQETNHTTMNRALSRIAK